MDIYIERGMWGSVVAGVLILLLIPSIRYLGLYAPANLAVMTALIAIAIYVYRNFDRSLGNKFFRWLGPPVIGLAAVGVVMLALGLYAGAAAISISYWGEPVMGYFVYKKLREEAPTSSLLFLASAAAFAYTIPLVLLGPWEVPFAADAVKVAVLLAITRRSAAVVRPSTPPHAPHHKTS